MNESCECACYSASLGVGCLEPGYMDGIVVVIVSDIFACDTVVISIGGTL